MWIDNNGIDLIQPVIDCARLGRQVIDQLEVAAIG